MAEPMNEYVAVGQSVHSPRPPRLNSPPLHGKTPEDSGRVPAPEQQQRQVRRLLRCAGAAPSSVSASSAKDTSACSVPSTVSSSSSAATAPHVARLKVAGVDEDLGRERAKPVELDNPRDHTAAAKGAAPEARPLQLRNGWRRLAAVGAAGPRSSNSKPEYQSNRWQHSRSATAAEARRRTQPVYHYGWRPPSQPEHPPEPLNRQLPWHRVQDPADAARPRARTARRPLRRRGSPPGSKPCQLPLLLRGHRLSDLDVSRLCRRLLCR